MKIIDVEDLITDFKNNCIKNCDNCEYFNPEENICGLILRARILKESNVKIYENPITPTVITAKQGEVKINNMSKIGMAGKHTLGV